MGKLLFYIGIFFLTLIPLSVVLVSELVGGWTTIYTRNKTIKKPFTTSDISDLKEKVAIVTGGNTGIGYETAKELAKKGARVIITVRSKEKGEATLSRLTKDIGNTENLVSFLELDLGSLSSVKKFANEFVALNLPLHMLVLNAGIMKSPGSEFVGQEMRYGFSLTSDGFEEHIGVNYLSHYYLTRLLAEKLITSSPSRIVALSSSAHVSAYEEGIRFDMWLPTSIPPEYEDGRAYGQSKLAQLLFAKELAKQLDGTGVTAYSCHPGVISTELSRSMDKEFKKQSAGSAVGEIGYQIFGWVFNHAMFSPQDGALTQLYLATTSSDALINGGFYWPLTMHVNETAHAQGMNTTLQEELWSRSEKIIEEKTSSPLPKIDKTCKN